MTFTPISPDRTLLTGYWLVDQDAEPGTDYDEEALIAYWHVTTEQDAPLCESVQRGMAMPSYTPGPLNRVHQGGQAGFFAWYRTQLREQPGFDPSDA